jgi:Spy/CpxP family protein refolding chaperone
MKMRVTLASLVVLLGFTVAPIAAQGPSVFEHLGLTSDQRDKIKVIQDQIRQQNAPLREQLQQLLGGKRFRDLSPEERESFKPQLEPIRKQMMDNRKKGREQISAILTPDQRKQLEQEMREHRKERGEGLPS